jgi:hypothetical protein
MTDDPVARLLEEAVPGIPDELRRPPVREVRARARRRRTRRNAVAAAVVTTVLLTGPAFWYQSTRGESQRPPSGGNPVPTTAAVGTKITWWKARVDRTGTKVTLYVTRPPDEPPCDGTWRLRAGTTVGADEVTAVVEDVSATGMGCSPDNFMTPVQVTLPEPLADRALVDGYDGSSRPVYREADLPKVPTGPDGWSEVPGHFSVGHGPISEQDGAWYLGYTRSGGPDIRITGAPPMQALTSDGARIDTVDVAGAPGTIYTHPDEATGYELRWEASGVVYLLALSPVEGERISLGEFREVLGRLGIR